MAVDFYVAGVPCQRSSSGPDIIGLHPEFRYRLFRALTDPRLKGSSVYSGRRSTAHQAKLYEAYLARGRTHPIVAVPGRSLHNERPVGFKWGNLKFLVPWSIAADIQFAGRPSRVVDPIMSEHGLHRIKSETWHFQPNKNHIVTAITGRGDRGQHVKDLQWALNRKGLASLELDGSYGPATAAAVVGFQQANKLPARGDWTLREQAILERAPSPPSTPSGATGGGDPDRGEREALRKIRAIVNQTLNNVSND